MFQMKVVTYNTLILNVSEITLDMGFILICNTIGINNIYYLKGVNDALTLDIARIKFQ